MVREDGDQRKPTEHVSTATGHQGRRDQGHASSTIPTYRQFFPTKSTYLTGFYSPMKTPTYQMTQQFHLMLAANY